LCSTELHSAITCSLSCSSGLAERKRIRILFLFSVSEVFSVVDFESVNN
jgi:hypothetical protein